VTSFGRQDDEYDLNHEGSANKKHLDHQNEWHRSKKSTVARVKLHENSQEKKKKKKGQELMVTMVTKTNYKNFYIKFR
jgi:hypothetical protein